MAAIPDERTRCAVRKVLAAWAGHRVFFPAALIREAQVETAVALLRSGMSRAQVVAALQSRCGISAVTAYRRVNLALGKRFRRS
jgi:hypothetical protein